MLRVTTVLPVYGRIEFAQRAIRSVLDQGVPECELIVVDDGSPVPLKLDGLDQGDVQIVLLRHDSNRGAAAARNAGLRAARGEWVAFLDSDDRWPSGSLRQRLDWADRNARNSTIWSSGIVEVCATRSRIRIPVPGDAVEQFASGCWFWPGSTALFQRLPVLSTLGFQDESLGRLEDLDWFLRWGLIGGQVAVAPLIGAEIHRGPRPAAEIIRKSATAILRKHSSLPSRLRTRLASYLDLEIAASDFAHGQYLAGAWCLARSLARRPRINLSIERFWRLE